MNIHERINCRNNANLYNIAGLFAHVYSLIGRGFSFSKTKDLCLFRHNGYHRSGKNHSQYPGFLFNSPDMFTLLRNKTLTPSHSSTTAADEYFHANTPYLNQPVSFFNHPFIKN